MAGTAISLKVTFFGGLHSRRSRPLCFICALIFSQWALADPVEEPEDYRLDQYDAEVPATLKGATRVTAQEVARLQLDEDVLIVDVIPEHIKPDDLPADQQWFPVPHRGIAGALWLPDVGYGSLSDTTNNYFKSHLLHHTDGEKNYPVVFYCRIDCWMSWNAAKRAVAQGYTRVFWFADGIDDWQFEDFATEILKPALGRRH